MTASWPFTTLCTTQLSCPRNPVPYLRFHPMPGEEHVSWNSHVLLLNNLSLVQHNQSRLWVLTNVFVLLWVLCRPVASHCHDNEVSTLLFIIQSYLFFIATSLRTHSPGEHHTVFSNCQLHTWPEHLFPRHHSLLVCAITPKLPGTQSGICYTQWWSSCWILSSIRWEIRTSKAQSENNTFFSYWMHALINLYFCYYRTHFCDCWMVWESSSLIEEENPIFKKTEYLQWKEYEI